MSTEEYIDQYLLALNAGKYQMQLVHANRERYPPRRFCYSPDQLQKSVSYLKFMNRQGYNIYGRPVGYQYILIDDLKREMLEALAYMKPCLLMETSPRNYQAFLLLPQVPSSREQSLSICREVCLKFEGDLGSAEPDHMGRIPGFINYKEKHRSASGSYPWVKLHGAKHRYSTFLPLGGACAQIKNSALVTNAPLIPTKTDRSREDFNTACMLIRQGKPDEYIADALLAKSTKAQERGLKYIELTIRNAKKSVGK